MKMKPLGSETQSGSGDTVHTATVYQCPKCGAQVLDTSVECF